MGLRPIPPSLQLASLLRSSVGVADGVMSTLSNASTSQLDSYQVRLTGEA